MSDRKYLKGFANFGFFLLLANSGENYAADSTYHAVPGAISCSPSNSKSDFTIYADDGVWDSGTDWQTSELTVTFMEVELETIALLTGASLSSGVLEEGILDDPPEVALTFSALRADNSYRLFRYYVCKCTNYKVTHNTKTESRNAQNYELTFRALPRHLDGKMRGTKDVVAGDSLSWLHSVS